jgi:hypothetical protein
MPPVVFEPTISADEWPKTYALERAATGTGLYIDVWFEIYDIGLNTHKCCQRYGLEMCEGDQVH